MSEDSSDVMKALAAFGAPAIRYHSFGQSPVRPSSVVLPRRVALAPEPVLTKRQMEPAPEPLPWLRAAPPAHPAPPPAIHQERSPSPIPSDPSAAPPPRPLAEWAAPVSAPRQARPEPMAEAPSRVSDAASVTPAMAQREQWSPAALRSGLQPGMASVLVDERAPPAWPDERPATPARPPNVPKPAPRLPETRLQTQHSAANTSAKRVALPVAPGAAQSSSRSLAEVFAFLAATPIR